MALAGERLWRRGARAMRRLWRAAYGDPSELLYQMAAPRRAEWEEALRRHGLNSAKPGRISRNR